MTKDDLPPLPAVPLPNGFPVEQHGVIAKFAQDYALAAIAAHDAKREKVLLIRTPSMVWHQAPLHYPSHLREDNVERAWAYIEREGA